MSPIDERRLDQAVDAVGALGNRTRLEILLALADAAQERQEQWLTLSFTELYGAVDIDSTSQFSYHLDRLIGQFVAEEPDGYRLTYGGDKIVRTVRSGVYESSRSFDDIDISGVCPGCGDAALVAAVDRERFVVRCRSCEATLLTDLLPRSQTRNRSVSAIVDSVGYRIWSLYTLVRGSVCPECFGQIDTVVGTHDLEGRTFHTLEHTCAECQFTIHMPIEVSAAFHPAVVGHFWDHGISLLDTPLWEFFEYIVTGVVTTTVARIDPLEATFEIAFDDETLRLRMDDSLTVSLESVDD